MRSCDPVVLVLPRFNFSAAVAMAKCKHGDANEQEVKVWLGELVDVGLVVYEDGQWCQVSCTLDACERQLANKHDRAATAERLLRTWLPYRRVADVEW